MTSKGHVEKVISRRKLQRPHDFFQHAPKVVYSVLLGGLTFEIVVRRWGFGQLPTQLSPVMVYVLVGVNVLLLVNLWFPLLARHSRTEKN